MRSLQIGELALGELAGRFLADPSASWSVGTFGAIAEFMRDADEAVSVDAPAAQVVTPRGAIGVVPEIAVRPIAYETISAAPGSWNHAVALCLPEAACAMNGRTVVTELGPDRGACRADDRDSILFDLGLGALQVDACVRASQPELVAALRAGAGRSLFEHGNTLMQALLAFSPNRVFTCRFGRVEVFQPIPPPGGQSPDGPHTHVLPKLLAHGRTHAATNPIPQGWVPCMHLYPAHPIKDGAGKKRPFDGDSHASFQALLERFGLPETVAVKLRVAAAVRDHVDPAKFPVPDSREQRTALRVCLRQLAAMQKEDATVAAWRAQFDAAAAD